MYAYSVFHGSPFYSFDPIDMSLMLSLLRYVELSSRVIKSFWQSYVQTLPRSRVWLGFHPHRHIYCLQRCDGLTEQYINKMGLYQIQSVLPLRQMRGWAQTIFFPLSFFHLCTLFVLLFVLKCVKAKLTSYISTLGRIEVMIS